MRNPALGRDYLRLGALSCPRRPQKNQCDLTAGLVHVSLDSALTHSAQPTTAEQPSQLCPIPAPANAAAARAEPFIMTHDQLRLDLGDRVHGHADNDQQRGAAKIKGHA